ncbi:oxysterol-binding protein-related protein 4B-like isoform X1 [Juglans microcarpa x Juglans regia]|uniref:oxysterol-binding protein-related protein 4B-like isoform X1 n=2 Tax=Juglans microcarpa x Juglans regia TaxID=2249226 RepID=UPI001B7E056B|nr:oxysterol-binding protein-related protein 4B-like isoform X1 [Juglans microcarpa x Juglans regia]
MVTGGKRENMVVLTKPETLEGEQDADYTAPNPLQLILSLFKNVRPGSDLTRFQLPPLLNLPKSQLQSYGETVYCTATDMLSRCHRGEGPHERLIAVVAWSISTLRPVKFGVAPYNPVLGETHHVSRGNFNFLLEQVSHHPPVSALHATNEEENVELTWCHRVAPKFHGTSVEAVLQGKRQMKLLSHGETYVMNAPNLSIRFLPGPGTDWVGNVRIQCQETGLEAEYCCKSSSFMWRRGNHRSIKGKIFESSSLKTLYEIDGHWDRIVRVKDINSGEFTDIYNAKEVISRLNATIVKDPRELWPSESAVVWSEVSQCILSKDWEKAREAKRTVEEKQRQLLRERGSIGESWVPKHFTVSHSKENGWDCSPIQKRVPPGPIVVPL